MNITSPASPFRAIIRGLPGVIPVAAGILTTTVLTTTVTTTAAIAQNAYVDQLPPSPAVDAGSTPSFTYNAADAIAFRVIIPSDNPTLLTQAKAIEPTAFLQTLNGQRVIQVGLYSNESLARQQVSRFQDKGMPVVLQSASGIPTSAAMAPQPLPPSDPNPVGLTPTALNPTVLNPNPLNPNPLNPNPLPVVQTSAKGYYVIIPTAAGDVNFVQAQLNQLGIPPQYIFLRDRPFGIHYAVGVFSQRGDADKMAEGIRTRAKLDSRVHFER